VSIKYKDHTIHYKMPKLPPQTETAHSDEEGEDQDDEPNFEQGFWAVEVVPGKTFKQKSKVNIVHITHASLGVEAKGRNVLLSNNLPVCVLTAGKDEHTNLDLRYVSQQEMAFSVSGSSSITLSGYYEYDNPSDDDVEENFFLDQAREMEDEDEDEDEEMEGRKKDVLIPLSKMAIGSGDGEDEEDEENEEAGTLKPGNNKKRPAPSADKTQTPANKKAKQEGGTPKNINTSTPNKQAAGTTDKTPAQIGSGTTPQQGGKSESNKKANDQKKSGPGSEKKGPPQNQGNKGSPGAKPFEFRFGIGAVIKGLDLGINGMFVGGKRTLTIPPSLAYGLTGGLNGKVPPNAIIEYDIELVDVINK